MVKNADGKVCNKCGEYKLIGEFFTHKLHRDGHSSTCKACDKKRNQLYRERNYDRVRAMDSVGKLRWRLEHPEEFKAKQYKQNHSESHRDWELRVREHTNERKRIWKSNNPDKVKRIQKDHYERNKEEIKVVNKIYKHLRRSAGTLTKKDLYELIAGYNNKCCYCGQDVGNKPTIDHIVPVSAGGKTVMDNLTLACSHCNCSKNNSSLLQFMYRSVNQ